MGGEGRQRTGQEATGLWSPGCKGLESIGPRVGLRKRRDPRRREEGTLAPTLVLRFSRPHCAPFLIPPPRGMHRALESGSTSQGHPTGPDVGRGPTDPHQP